MMIIMLKMNDQKPSQIFLLLLPRYIGMRLRNYDAQSESFPPHFQLSLLLLAPLVQLDSGYSHYTVIIVSPPDDLAFTMTLNMQVVSRNKY